MIHICMIVRPNLDRFVHLVVNVTELPFIFTLDFKFSLKVVYIILNCQSKFDNEVACGKLHLSVPPYLINIG